MLNLYHTWILHYDGGIMNEMISYKNVISNERLMNKKLSPLAVSCGDDYHVCVNRMVKLLYLTGFSLDDDNLNDILYKFNYTPTTHLYALTLMIHLDAVMKFPSLMI